MTAVDDQLLKAASAGDLAGVSEALGRGVNVNAKDEYNNTSLNWAALWGHGEVVKRLLETGADIENKGSGGGMTPLANAASRGHFDVAQILLDRGARVTDDLLSILQTKVNILEENREAGMVTEEGVASWKQVLDFFITQRMKQDLPDVVPQTASADPVERREAATRVAEAAQRGIDVTAAAAHLSALLADADPETRRHAGSAFTHHLTRVDGWARICEILGSADVGLRLAAADALLRAEKADASLVPPLGSLLQDGDAEVRKTAAIAVATLPGKGIDAKPLLPRMIELLADAESAVRRSAAFAFRMWSKRGLRDYCSPALPVLRSIAERDDNEAVRAFAAQVVAAEEGAP
jgi:ankyrin repeat protein/non-SMC mitotic condensation complex subunit 1